MNKNKAARLVDLERERATIASQLAGLPQYQPRITEGYRARWNPTVGAYVDPNGNLYDRGGQPVGQPASPGTWDPAATDYWNRIAERNRRR